MKKNKLLYLLLSICFFFYSCASSEFQLAYRVPLLKDPNKKFILAEPLVKYRTEKTIPVGSKFVNSSEIILMAKKHFEKNKESILKSLQAIGNASNDTDKFSIYKSDAKGNLFYDFPSIASFLKRKNATHLVVPYISIINIYNKSIVTSRGERYKIYCPSQNFSLMEFSLVVFNSEGELAFDTNEFQSREKILETIVIEAWNQKDKKFSEEALAKFFIHNTYSKVHTMRQEGNKCGMMPDSSFLTNAFESMRFDLLKDL